MTSGQKRFAVQADIGEKILVSIKPVECRQQTGKLTFKVQI